MGSSKKTATTNSTSQATTTPNVPGYAADPAANYYGQVNNLLQRIGASPNDFNTPANGLQQGAYDQALSGMGGWVSGLSQSNALAMGAAQSGIPSVNTATYAAPTVASVGRPSVANMMPTQQAAATGYNVPTLGAAAQAQSGGGAGVNLGPAAQAALSQAQAAQTGPAASLLDNLAAYANPVTGELVDANLAAFDDATARSNAAQEAIAAKNRAFGGSQYSIAESQRNADQARNRALTSAELRSNAFNQQTALAQADAARRQETSLFNTANQQQTNLANSAAANANSQFNAGQTNQQDQQRAGLQTQAGIAAGNNATQTNIANMQALNNRDSLLAQLQESAGQFNASAANQASQFNAGQSNQMNMGLFDALNNANMAEYQGNLSNAQQNANLAAQAGQFNAGQQNQMGQFNAGLQENALLRQLQAAGLLGENANAAAANQRADLTTQSQIGNDRYALDRANQMAPFTNLGALGDLMNPGLLSILTGQTVNGTESGTQTQKSSGGLLGTLGGLLGGIGGLAGGLGGLGVKL